MSARPAPVVPSVAAVLSAVAMVVSLLALAASMLSAPATAAPAADPTSSARAAGPAYGPWSGYYFDVRVRISTPTKKRARMHVQVDRNSADSGARQFYLTWRPAGGEQRSTRRKLVAPDQTITLVTSALPCGRSRVALFGRGRAPGGTYGDWKSFSADIRRAC
ncbi:MAG: hypothetical protein JWN84_1535 [Nocardioides sp.]|nr:hypothetical protein [Nocardioides sp.]